MPRPSKAVEDAEILPEAVDFEPVPPGPLSLVVRVGPPGQERIVFSQRVYAHTIDQQSHQAVITGALRPTNP